MVNNEKCESGYHYHPSHPKALKNGCMKNEDMDNNEKKCKSGYHYHPSHPKALKNGCMKNEDMKEDFGGSFSIYNAVRCSGRRRLNNTGSLMFIGV